MPAMFQSGLSKRPVSLLYQSRAHQTWAKMGPISMNWVVAVQATGILKNIKYKKKKALEFFYIIILVCV